MKGFGKGILEKKRKKEPLELRWEYTNNTGTGRTGNGALCREIDQELPV